MVTTEERMKILKMIEEGKVSAEDGAKLLTALSGARKTTSAGTVNMVNTGDSRWFRVRVTDQLTGKTKVNVNIPIGLVNVGLKVGARFAPGLEAEEMDAITQALNTGMTGKIIDVMDEEDGEHVEIFIE